MGRTVVDLAGTAQDIGDGIAAQAVQTGERGDVEAAVVLRAREARRRRRQSITTSLVVITGWQALLTLPVDGLGALDDASVAIAVCWAA